jgi:hypothetical protein
VAKHYTREENINQPQRAQNHVTWSNPNLKVVWYAERQMTPNQEATSEVNENAKHPDADFRPKNLSVLLHGVLLA